MRCPVCPDSTLLMSERQGVEIDYCPSCRGIWLDRGELDKLLALAGSRESAPAPAAARPAPQQPPYPGYPPAGRRDFDDSDFGKYHGGHRRKSWLSDFFD